LYCALANMLDFLYSNTHTHTLPIPAQQYIHTGWPKNWHHVLYTITSSNINRFSKFTVRIRRIFVITLSLKISPHLKCVATLPPMTRRSSFKAKTCFLKHFTYLYIFFCLSLLTSSMTSLACRRKNSLSFPGFSRATNLLFHRLSQQKVNVIMTFIKGRSCLPSQQLFYANI